nr:SCO2523 family variant P-loop protein [Dactylosporangium thailandense]
MLAFACAVDGGSGRSVTGANLLFRSALQGRDVCYLDLDPPTARALFRVEEPLGGIDDSVHEYLESRVAEPRRIDVWSESERETLRRPDRGTGRMVLLPGGRADDVTADPRTIDRFAVLLLRLEEEFDTTLVSLPAGRCHSLDMALAATAGPQLHRVEARWLVFHRWTRQHVVNTSDFVHGDRGLLHIGVARGHDRDALLQATRMVRTGVTEPSGPELAGLRPAQIAWLQGANENLQRFASRRGIGRVNLLGAVPHDPVLQWREQIITDDDVNLTGVANQATVDAFTLLAGRLADDEVWAGL